MSRSLSELANEAIDIQYACNFVGLSDGFARSMLELAAIVGHDKVCKHPIAQLWASKMHELAGMGLSNTERYGEALRRCTELKISSQRGEE